MTLHLTQQAAFATLAAIVIVVLAVVAGRVLRSRWRPAAAAPLEPPAAWPEWQWPRHPTDEQLAARYASATTARKESE